MDQKLTFTAYLQDQYSKKFDQLADKTDSGIKDITKDLDKLGRSGKTVARNLETIDNRISALQKARKLSLNTDTIKQADKEIKALLKEKERLEGSSSISSGGMFGGMGKGFAIAGGLFAAGSLIKGGISASIEAAMEREQQRISMGVLMGSQKAGDQRLQDITKMAAATPFETNDLIKANNTMLSFGVNSGKALDYMNMLGDISGGNRDRFDSLTLAFSQMSSTGRLMGQDLLQMVNAGFNPLNEISKMTGKSMATLKKDMEDGKISAEMVVKAIQHATGEGGLYHNMMQKQSQTTAGRLSTLRDNVNETAVAFGNRFKPTLDNVIDGLGFLVGSVKKWVEVPTSEKIRQESYHLQALQAELNSANISEERRKEILNEINSGYGITLKNLADHKQAYAELNGEINKVIQSLDNKSLVTGMKEALDDVDERIGKISKAKSDFFIKAFEGAASLDKLNQESVRALRINSAMTFDQKITSLKGMAEEAGYNYKSNDEAYNIFTAASQYGLYDKTMKDKVNERAEREKIMKETMNSLGIKPEDLSGTTNDAKGATTGAAAGKSSNDSSISGGSKITHLTINIDSLVKGGISIHKATVREGASEMHDLVAQQLLTAVNDANLAAK